MFSRFLSRRAAIFLGCAAALSALPAAGAQAPRTESPAEKIKQALAQPRDLEVADQPLDVAINQLREQTGINLVLDQTAVPPSAVIMPGQSPYAHLRVSVRCAGRPVREGLAKALRPHGLTFAVVGDTLLITTPEKAADRQLGQAVRVEAEGVSLKDLLHHLARDTGANVMLDQRLAKEGQTPQTVRLDDVPLETAVELLADQAGLKAVRMSNVLYVTTEARAEKLRRPPPSPAATGWQVWPDGTGGFRLTPPGGLQGCFIGFGGGMAGGGMLGALGVGGGIVGMGGMGGMGGAAPPVPLTPPLPKARPAPPKPKADPPPPAKPTAAPAGPAAPPAPDRKPNPANAPRPSKSVSRRKGRASWCS